MAVGADRYRRVLARFASGVTVVTVGGATPHGMTASSFASVSLDPPLILVCLDKTSQTRGLILEKGTFAVNVLGAGQEAIAGAFSRRGVKPFDALPHRFGSRGDPLLEEALAWLECTITEVVEAGDHDVVIAEVIACDAREGAPLLYYDRDYRRLTD